MLERFKKLLFEPVSSASLGLFRIAVGILLCWQFYRIEPYIVEVLAKQKFFLTYDFFHWIKIGTPEQLQALFKVSYIFCLLLAVGVLTRISSVFLFFSWTYIFLLDAGHYNNHFYLYSLILFLLIFVKSDQSLSLKNLLKPKEQRQYYIPYWQLFLFKAQMLLIYFWGGIAKFDYDWLRGYPMYYWLKGQSSVAWLNEILSTHEAALFFSYTGLVFDLSIGFLLWFKKTQKWALIPLIIFHTSNHFLFSIGTFPWFSLASTILFFDFSFLHKKQSEKEPLKMFSFKKWAFIFVSGYLIIQFLMPFRQYLPEGDPSWHGVGHKFSWRMMLADKIGKLKVKVKLPNDPNEYGIKLEEYICARQFRKITRSSKHLWRFAYFLEESAKQNGAPDVEVYVSAFKSLNGREFQQLIDSTYDLTTLEYHQTGMPPYVKQVDKTKPYKQNNMEVSIGELN